MKNIFNNTLYAVGFGLLGATIVSTKGFTETDSTFAQVLIGGTVAFGVAGIFVALSELKALREDARDKDMDSRLEDMWRAHERATERLSTEIDTVSSRTNQRMDQEVEALQNRLDRLSEQMNRRIDDDVRDIHNTLADLAIDGEIRASAKN